MKKNNMRRFMFFIVLFLSSCKSVIHEKKTDFKLECRIVDNDEICIYKQFKKSDYLVIGFKGERNNRIATDTLQVVNLKENYAINIGSIDIDGIDFAIIAIEDTLDSLYHIDSSQSIVKSWIYNTKKHSFSTFNRSLIRINEGYYER